MKQQGRVVQGCNLSYIIDCSHNYGHNLKVKTVSKGKLKAKMLQYFREVEASGEPLIVTDHGKEVLVIRPVGQVEQTTGLEMILQVPVFIPPRKETAPSDEVLLEELRVLATPVARISEEELMAPLPLSDWEIENEDDRNPWS